MQTSGSFPGLSDGTRKTIMGAKPPKARPAVPATKPRMMGTPEPAAPVHRRGGFAKHSGKAR